MRLVDLREYVGNILDYAPDAATYKTQVDTVINDAYRRLFSEKPWTFAQKAEKVMAYKDIDVSVVVTSGNSSITSTAAFTDAMAGNIIEIENVEYTISWVQTTSLMHLTTAVEASSGTYAAQVRFRYLDFPEDMISCLQVIKRTMDLTPQEPGRMTPLTRYEDEWYNLPLNEVNLPHYWVPYDDYNTMSPLDADVLAVSSGSGHGSRTVCFRMAHLQAGKRLSALSSKVEILLTNTKIARLTLEAMPNTSGLYRRLYACYSNGGLTAYRAVADDSGTLDHPPTATGTKDYTLPLTGFGENFAISKERYTGVDGNRQRFRLYPRQSADYEITVRYLYRPPELVEDHDSPEFPSAHHPILAYMALREIFVKHDNMQQANLYDRKVNIEILKMEQRYLTQTPRRWIKEAMGSQGLDVLPIYTPLVHS